MLPYNYISNNNIHMSNVLYVINKRNVNPCALFAQPNKTNIIFAVSVSHNTVLTSSKER